MVIYNSIISKLYNFKISTIVNNNVKLFYSKKDLFHQHGHHHPH